MAMGNGARFSNLRTDHYVRQRFCCRPSQARLFPLIVVVVVDLCGPASGPPFVKFVHLSFREQVVDRHIDPLPRGCLTKTPQKLFD